MLHYNPATADNLIPSTFQLSRKCAHGTFSDDAMLPADSPLLPSHARTCTKSKNKIVAIDHRSMKRRPDGCAILQVVQLMIMTAPDNRNTRTAEASLWAL